MAVVRSRTLERGTALLLAALIALSALDFGAVVLTKMSVSDDVRSAAHAAAAVVRHQHVSPQVAKAAHEAASADARYYGITVETEGFTVYPDGRVTLTGMKTAPTLLFHRIEALRDFTEVRTIVTVDKPLPYTS